MVPPLLPDLLAGLQSQCELLGEEEAEAEANIQHSRAQQRHSLTLTLLLVSSNQAFTMMMKIDHTHVGHTSAQDRSERQKVSSPIASQRLLKPPLTQQ